MTKPRIRTVPSRIPTAGQRVAPLSRPDAPTRGYDAAWVKAARAFKRANLWCLGCRAVGLRASATVVDHVVPHERDQRTFWDAKMWQPACAWHHNSIKKQLESLFFRGAIGVDQLWLDSKTAIAMTRDYRRLQKRR